MRVQYARIGGVRWLADYDQWTCILSGANESSPLHTGKYRYKYTYKLTAQENKQTNFTVSPLSFSNLEKYIGARAMDGGPMGIKNLHTQ